MSRVSFSTRGFTGVGFVLTSGGPPLGGLPFPHCGFRGDWAPRVEGVRGAGKGVGQGLPWSRYWSRWRLKGMPAIRSSSSLSSRTVMSLRQPVTRNTSPESSSSTCMTKTSEAKSSARLTACGSPTRLRPRARGCAGRGRGMAEPAPRPSGPPASGSGRRAPPRRPGRLRRRASSPPPPRRPLRDGRTTSARSGPTGPPLTKAGLHVDAGDVSAIRGKGPGRFQNTGRMH